MKGTVTRKKRNKFGYFIIVVDENGISYKGDSHFIADEVLISISVNDIIEFEYELSSTGNPTIISLEVVGKLEGTHNSVSDKGQQVELTIDLIIENLGNYINENGYMLASDMPKFLINICSIDYKKFSKTIAEFVEQHLTDKFTLLKEINVAGKRIPNVLVRNEDVDKYTTTNVIQELTQEIIETIETRIQEIIDNNGVFLCSVFPSFIREFGIEDYRNYATSIEIFVEKYFPSKFAIKKNFKINDKFYPSVIVSSGFTEKARCTSHLENNVSKDIAYEELDRLFDSRDYIGYLKSPTFSQADLSVLPLAYLEKGVTCAQNLLDDEFTDDYTLSFFQRELISCRTTLDFIHKWKKGPNFNDKILDSCGKTTIYELTMPKDKGRITRLLNDIGKDTKPNNAISCLISRFDLCKNEIVPYLYLIKLLGCQSVRAIEQCIGEYCYYIKNLNTYNVQVCQRKIPFDKQILYFKKFLDIAFNNNEIEISKNLRTNILSVFFDLKQAENIDEILNIIDPKHKTPEWLLSNFMSKNYWEESQVVELFNNNISLLLIEKGVAVIWDRYHAESTLSKNFLDVLSWIIKYGNFKYLDEIIRFHYHHSSNYNKKHKQIVLANSVQVVIESLYDNDAAFNLVSYIFNYIYPDLSSDDAQSFDKSISGWNETMQKYFSSRVEECMPLSLENEKEFLSLISVFALDNDKAKEIQNIYGSWYIEQHNWMSYTSEQIFDLLKQTYEKGCYRAFQLVYEQYVEHITTVSELHELYINALIQLGAYGKAIRYTYESEYINPEIREKQITKALCGNFEKFGFSQGGLLVFDDNFTVQEAIDILNRQFAANDYAVILSLIVLYAHNDELVKSVYLFSIFHTRAEVGFTRVYSQFRTLYGHAFRKVHNHYDVIQTAFNTLPVNALLSFIKWASKITIPDFSDYYPSHPFSIFYDGLLKNIEDLDVWKRTFGRIIEKDKKEKNAWLICVCGMIMMQKFDMPDNSIISESFELVIEDDSVEKPRNLLYFLCQYIVNTDKTYLCNKLGKLLQDKNTKMFLLENNPWCRHNVNSIESFLDFCYEKLQETGNLMYFDIITNLKIEITSKELLDLSHYSMSKSFLIKKICQCYMDSNGKDEAKELLNKNLWANSTYQEKEIYNVLKLAYENDLLVMTNYPHFFENETDVLRFKQDCVKIIADYPESTSLLKFIDECQNLKHKLAVFSFTLGVFYIEDIYHTYWLDYNQLKENELLDVYLYYLKKCYEAQLVYNPSYVFEYKIWRYYKILMIDILEDGVCDDVSLCNLMKQNNHYDRLLSEGYDDFKNSVKELYEVNEITDLEKESLFFGLITADFSCVLDINNSPLLKLSDHSREVLKNILSFLNYRDVNEKFYSSFVPVLTLENAPAIIELANTFSDTVSLALNEWIYKDIWRSNPELLLELTIKANAPGKAGGNICVGKVLSLDKKVYSDNYKFINAILASKQLPGKIFDRLRIAVIHGEDGWLNNNIQMLATYLYDNGYAMAFSQYKYLVALWYCKQKNHAELNEYLHETGTEFLENVPADWRGDAYKILNYANNENAGFDADDSFYYSESYLSAPQTPKTKQFVCFDFLKDIYNVTNEHPTARISKEIIEKCSTESDEAVAMRLSFLDFEENRNSEDYNKIAVETCFMAISNDSRPLQPIHKLEILIDLYKQRDYLTQIQREHIVEIFREIYRDFSIEVWVDNIESIINILSLGEDLERINEIEKLVEHILEKCPIFNEKITARASEMLYNQLKTVVFIGKSSYVSAIKSSVLRRQKQIESGSRIVVNIENDKLQDGCVYFQLQNNGYVTVDLQDKSDIIMTVTLSDNRVAEYSVDVTDINELRAGWITGCKQDISELCKQCSVGEILDIEIAIKVNDRLISKETACLTICEPSLLKSRPRPEYEVKFAAGDSKRNKLYGRSEEQDDIAYYLESGKVVIYGPSRIGKTSLLNWVRHDLATEKGNVITLLFGGERGKGKDSDYKEYFYDSNRSLIYDGVDKSKINTEISKYLLIDTLKYGLKETKYGRANFNADVMQDKRLLDCIHEILEQDESIEYRYQQIDKLLKQYNTELWILFDEFQQVVEKWSGINDSEPTEFIRLCESINEVDITNIKLVFCGSDELLHQFVLIKENSIWREKILNTAGKVRVGPIKVPAEGKKDAFKEMIIEDDSVKKPGITYSEEALNTLCVYTARIPLYAKEICNTVIESIANIGALNFGRNTIYSYDIARATQFLLNVQKDELEHESRNKFNTAQIVEIFKAVTKGLEEDTDKQYLWYIAKWFVANPTKDRFPYSEFANTDERYLTYGEDVLMDSLTVAKERGIISGDEHIGYVFSTVFYHNAFCGTANKLDEGKIFTYKNHSTLESNEPTLSKIDYYLKQMSLDEKKDYLWNLYGKITREDGDYPEYLRKNIGNTQNIGGDVVVDGGKTITTNIQINAQTINSAFTTLLAPGASAENFLEAFNALPRLTSYIEGEQQERLHKSSQALLADYTAYDNCFDNDGHCIDESKRVEIEKRIIEHESALEDISAPAEQKLLSDTVGAVVNSDDFMTLSEERWQELLGLKSISSVAKLKSLPSEFVAPLTFAVVLHNVFDNVYKKTIEHSNTLTQELDYCPVAIMYCKLVEAMLKQGHTPMYIRCLGEKSLSGGQATFADLGTPDNFDSSNKELTIGSYVSQLVFLPKSKFILDKAKEMPKPNDFRFTATFKDETIDFNDNIRRLIDNQYMEEEMLPSWKSHARALKIIHIIRNSSAHEAAPITKKVFDWLIEVLFNQGELLKIWELTENS